MVAEFVVSPDERVKSREYKLFKKERMFTQPLNLYEKMCKFSSRFLKLKAPAAIRNYLKNPIYMSDLQATENEVFSLTIFSLIVSAIAMLPLFPLVGEPVNLILPFIPLFVGYNMIAYPKFYSDVVRIRAGNETVKIILYLVIYLSYSPVFVKAVDFTLRHCTGPLGMNLRKAMWDLEMGKYVNIKEALGAYSKKWVLWNENFVTSLAILQSIEMTHSEQTKQQTLKRALNNMLDGTYNEMKTYAKDLRTPAMLIHSMGIILPIFGLVMFPLISIFMSNKINPLFIGLGYVVVLPAILWWFMYRTISKRPGAFSHSQKSGGVKPKKYLNVGKGSLPILMTSLLVGIIIMIPGIMYFSELYTDHFEIYTSYDDFEAANKWKDYSINIYKSDNIIFHMFQSMFIFWGLAAFVILYTYWRSHAQKKLEDEIAGIERQFEVGVFELANGLEENAPMESVIPQVLQKYKLINMSHTPMYNFFKKVLRNMTEFTMTFSRALFDPKSGVLMQIPSNVIRDIMQMISNALTKGPKITALISRNIGNYMRSIRRVEEMIKDMLDDVISSLKIQASFIAPFITAVIASVATLIVQFLQNISLALERIENSLNIGNTVIGSATQGMGSALSLIKIEEVLPPTVLQLIVGIYLVEIVIIISIMLNGINKGFDEVSRDNLIFKNLLIATIFYTIIIFLTILFFQPLVAQVGGF